jgi:hypothetical protein
LNPAAAGCGLFFLWPSRTRLAGPHDRRRLRSMPVGQPRCPQPVAPWPVLALHNGPSLGAIDSYGSDSKSSRQRTARGSLRAMPPSAPSSDGLRCQPPSASKLYLRLPKRFAVKVLIPSFDEPQVNYLQESLIAGGSVGDIGLVNEIRDEVDHPSVPGARVDNGGTTFHFEMLRLAEFATEEVHINSLACCVRNGSFAVPIDDSIYLRMELLVHDSPPKAAAQICKELVFLLQGVAVAQMLCDDQKNTPLISSLISDHLAESLRTGEVRIEETTAIIKVDQVVGPFGRLLIQISTLKQNIIKATVQCVKTVFQVFNIRVQEHEMLLILRSLDSCEAAEHMLPSHDIAHLLGRQTQGT